MNLSDVQKSAFERRVGQEYWDIFRAEVHNGLVVLSRSWTHEDGDMNGNWGDSSAAVKRQEFEEFLSSIRIGAKEKIFDSRNSYHAFGRYSESPIPDEIRGQDYQGRVLVKVWEGRDLVFAPTLPPSSEIPRSLESGEDYCKEQLEVFISANDKYTCGRIVNSAGELPWALRR